MAVPERAASLALIVDDPNAPIGTFTHRLAWEIDPAGGGLQEGERASREGRYGFGQTGDRGACPPGGRGPSRSFLRLYALSAEPGARSGASRQEFERALEDMVLARAELVGKCVR